MIHSPLQRFFSAVLFTACSMAVLVCAAGFYLIATEAGGKAVARFVLKHYVPAGMVTVGKYTGTIRSGLTLQDIEIKNLPAFSAGSSIRIPRLTAYIPLASAADLLLRVEFVVQDIEFAGIPGFPAGSSARIQRLLSRIPLLNPTDLSLNMFNGRLYMLGCDPIVIEGEYAKGSINGKAYTRVLDVHTLVSSVMEEKFLKHVQGFFTDTQIGLQGPLMTPRVIGTFFVDRVKFQGTTVSQGPGRVEAKLDFSAGQVKLTGDLMMESGLVNTRNRDIDLRPSKAMFRGGDLTNPELDIKGNTQVENISIDFFITGKLYSAKMRLNSQPPLSEDVLWAVLAGGKTWTPAMEKSNEDKTVDLKKQLTDDFNVGLQLEQLPRSSIGQNQQTEYSKKLEGEMLLTDRLSVNVGQEILHEQNGNELSGANPVTDSHRENESEIFLKYKNKF